MCTLKQKHQIEASAPFPTNHPREISPETQVMLTTSQAQKEKCAGEEHTSFTLVTNAIITDCAIIITKQKLL
jgi:hypothetical protein